MSMSKGRPAPKLVWPGIEYGKARSDTPVEPSTVDSGEMLFTWPSVCPRATTRPRTRLTPRCDELTNPSRSTGSTSLKLARYGSATMRTSTRLASCQAVVPVQAPTTESTKVTTAPHQAPSRRKRSQDVGVDWSEAVIACSGCWSEVDRSIFSARCLRGNNARGRLHPIERSVPSVAFRWEDLGMASPATDVRQALEAARRDGLEFDQAWPLALRPALSGLAQGAAEPGRDVGRRLRPHAGQRRRASAHLTQFPQPSGGVNHVEAAQPGSDVQGSEATTARHVSRGLSGSTSVEFIGARVAGASVGSLIRLRVVPLLATADVTKPPHPLRSILGSGRMVLFMYVVR